MTQRWNYYLAERPFSRFLGQPLSRMRPTSASVHLAKPANFDRQAASLQGAATALLTRRS